MRVVISDLPPQLPDKDIELTLDVVKFDGEPVLDGQPTPKQKAVTVTNFTLNLFADFKRQVDVPPSQPRRLSQAALNALGLTLAGGASLLDAEFAEISQDTLIEAANKFEGKFGKSVIPLNEQFFTNGFAE